MDSNQTKLTNLLTQITIDPTTSQDLKRMADDVRSELPVFQTDIWIYRGVVFVLGLTVLGTIAGGLFLAFKGDAQNFKLPAEIVAIGSAAVGALAGLLAPAPNAAAK